MNINELTDEQKSVLLARLQGWERQTWDIGQHKDGETVGYLSNGVIIWHNSDGWGLVNFDLYDPANMPLLAKVIEWACQNMDEMDGMEPVIYFDTFFDPLNFHKSMRLFADAVLETAVKAGMVAQEAK